MQPWIAGMMLTTEAIGARTQAKLADHFSSPREPL